MLTPLSSNFTGANWRADNHYFDTYVPSLANAPATSWSTDAEKDKHLGDLFYNKSTGLGYRFSKTGSVYSWELLKDTDFSSWPLATAAVQDTLPTEKAPLKTTHHTIRGWRFMESGNYPWFNQGWTGWRDLYCGQIGRKQATYRSIQRLIILRLEGEIYYKTDLKTSKQFICCKSKHTLAIPIASIIITTKKLQPLELLSLIQRFY